MNLANEPVRSITKSSQTGRQKVERANYSPYKPKKGPNEHTPKKKLRRQIIKRDGDWCLLCGAPPPNLQMHRVIYGSEGGRYMIHNCVQLCSYCHVPIVHASKKKWQPLLMKYLQTEIKEWG